MKLYSLITLVLLSNLCYSQKSISDFTYELIPFKKGTMYGYMDRKGDIKIAPQFIEAELFTKDKIAKVKGSKGYGFINQNGDIICPLVLDYGKEPWKMKPHLARYINSSDDRYNRSISKNYGYYCPGDGLSYVLFKRSPEFIFSEQYYSDFIGYEDHEGGYYEELPNSRRDFFIDQLCKVRKKNDKYNYVDTSFNEIFKSDYKQIDKVSDSLFTVTIDNGEYLKHINDRDSIAINYRFIRKSSNKNVVIASTYSKKNEFYSNDLMLIADSTTNYHDYIGNDRFLSKEGYFESIKNKHGKLLLPYKYHNIESFGDSILIATKGHDIYLINDKDSILAGPYDRITKRGGLAEASRDSTYYLINSEGKNIAKRSLNSRSYSQNISQLHNQIGLKVLPLNGDLLETTEVAVVFQSQEEAIYIVTTLEGKTIQKGIYSDKDGWIMQPKICLVEIVGNTQLNNTDIEVQTIDSLISYKWSPDYSSYTRHSTLQRRESLKINLSDSSYIYDRYGHAITLDKTLSLNPWKYQNGLYLYKSNRGEQAAKLYDLQMNSLLPDSIYSFLKFRIHNEDYIRVQDKNRNEGLYSLSKSWIHNIEKGHQFRKGIGKVYQMVTDQETFLYDSEHNKLSNKAYTSIKNPTDLLAKSKKSSKFIIGESPDGKSDVYNSLGTKIYTGTKGYGSYASDGYIAINSLEKGKICLLDTTGVRDCYDAQTLYPNISKELLLTVERENLYGVIRENGSTVIDLLYGYIQYNPYLKIFYLDRLDRTKEIRRASGEILATGRKEDIAIHPFTESSYGYLTDDFEYYYLRDKLHYTVFNRSNKVVQTFDGVTAAPFIDKKLLENNLIRFGKDLYGDLKTGRLYR